MWDTPATRHEGTEEPELTSPRHLDGILREAGDRGVRDGLRAGKKGAEKAQRVSGAPFIGCCVPENLNLFQYRTS